MTLVVAYQYWFFEIEKCGGDKNGSITIFKIFTILKIVLIFLENEFLKKPHFCQKSKQRDNMHVDHNLNGLSVFRLRTALLYKKCAQFLSALWHSSISKKILKFPLNQVGFLAKIIEFWIPTIDTYSTAEVMLMFSHANVLHEKSLQDMTWDKMITEHLSFILLYKDIWQANRISACKVHMYCKTFQDFAN